MSTDRLKETAVLLDLSHGGNKTMELKCLTDNCTTVFKVLFAKIFALETSFTEHPETKWILDQFGIAWLPCSKHLRASFEERGIPWVAPVCKQHRHEWVEPDPSVETWERSQQKNNW